jgi:hypothetical protein
MQNSQNNKIYAYYLINKIFLLEYKINRPQHKADINYFKKIMKYCNKYALKYDDPRFAKINNNTILYNDLIKPMYFNNNEKKIICILENILYNIKNTLEIAIGNHNKQLFNYKFENNMKKNRIMCHNCYSFPSNCIQNDSFLTNYYEYKAWLLVFFPNDITQICINYISKYDILKYNNFSYDSNYKLVDNKKLVRYNKYSKYNKYDEDSEYNVYDEYEDYYYRLQELRRAKNIPCYLKKQSNGLYFGVACKKLYELVFPSSDILLHSMSLDATNCRFTMK